MTTPAELREMGVVIISDSQGLERLKGILLGNRGGPCIVLPRSTESSEPAVPPGRIRAILGPEPRIYFVTDDHLLPKFRTALGSSLAVSRGALRIYWPGLNVQADPFAHPLLVPLDEESIPSTLRELEQKFDLSRPTVRPVVKLIEDARSVLAREVTRLETELRETKRQLCQAQGEARSERARAVEAERRLQTSKGPP